MLRRDVTLAMPPHAIWLRGSGRVSRFFGTPRFSAFWATVVRVDATRANGRPALAFHRRLEDGTTVPHSLMVVDSLGGRVSEMTTFIGAGYFHGFELPA